MCRWQQYTVTRIMLDKTMSYTFGVKLRLSAWRPVASPEPVASINLLPRIKKLFPNFVKIAPMYMWREKATKKWSRLVIYIIACCHTAKIWPLAATAFRLQKHSAFHLMFELRVTNSFMFIKFVSTFTNFYSCGNHGRRKREAGRGLAPPWI